MHSDTDMVFLISRYNNQQQIFLTEQAITRGNIQFFIINEINDQPFILSKADIGKLRKARVKTRVIIEPARMDVRFPSQICAFEYSQAVGFDELLVSESKADELLKMYGNASEYASFNLRQQHNTPLLVLLDKAIEEFWLNSDPDAPPKQDAIISWLSSQGITQNQAKAIDLIIRPPVNKRGGNRGRKKPKGLTQK